MNALAQTKRVPIFGIDYKDKAEAALANLDVKKTLAENLHGVFARKTSPIWMDSSTTAECAEIRKKLGGIKYTASRTGSDAFERFTGPQIRKFFKTEPDAYTKTFSIALVSSFLASLLAGKTAPIDFGDGAGMNLMDIRNKVWDMEALKATAPSLKKKLPPLAATPSAVSMICFSLSTEHGPPQNTSESPPTSTP